jgi:hypothetical protein
MCLPLACACGCDSSTYTATMGNCGPGIWSPRWSWNIQSYLTSESTKHAVASEPANVCDGDAPVEHACIRKHVLAAKAW